MASKKLPPRSKVGNGRFKKDPAKKIKSTSANAKASAKPWRK